MKRLSPQRNVGVVTRLWRWLAPDVVVRRKTPGSGAPLGETLAEELGHTPQWTGYVEDAMAPPSLLTFSTWHGSSGCL